MTNQQNFFLDKSEQEKNKTTPEHWQNMTQTDGHWTSEVDDCGRPTEQLAPMVRKMVVVQFPSGGYIFSLRKTSETVVALNQHVPLFFSPLKKNNNNRVKLNSCVTQENVSWMRGNMEKEVCLHGRSLHYQPLEMVIKMGKVLFFPFNLRTLPHTPLQEKSWLWICLLKEWNRSTLYSPLLF